MQYDFLHSVVEEGVGTDFITTSASVIVKDLIISSDLFTNPVTFFLGDIGTVYDLSFALLFPGQYH